jgi:[ribosomal protein S5]-alanine N-acetyltransferase
MRVLEKAGYQKEGILRNTIIKHGEIMDEHVYAILR